MLKQRVITGAVFGLAVIFAVLLLPTPAAAAALGLLFLIGAWEWSGLARLGRPTRMAYTAGMAGVLLSAPAWIAHLGLIAAVLLAAVPLWAAALAAVVSYPRRLPLKGVAAGGVGVLVPAWAALAYLHGTIPQGAALTLTVFLIVWAADVGAYFTGRAIGRTRLAPHVSPGKTWEGVTGGVALAGLVAAGAAARLELPVAPLVAIGCVTALVSVLGDLTVSICKRNVGVKDTGRLLPGHGGMLDRIDSLTAAAPTFVLGLLAAGVIR